MAKYTRVQDGEWVRPKRRGYRMMCCDCGLVHVMNFRLIKTGRGAAIQFQAFRDDRRTALARRTRSPAVTPEKGQG